MTSTNITTTDGIQQTRKRTVHVRHCDPNGTGEGLGSHARGTLYPLMRVALYFGWHVIWTLPPGLGAANHRSEYAHELKDLASWLGLTTTTQEELDEWVGISIDLDADARLGRILGYAGILISSIEDFCQEHGWNAFFNDAQSQKDVSSEPTTTFLVTLHGRFQYQDDPTPPVIEWMQARCLTWKREARITHGYLNDNNGDSHILTLRIAIHIRCPEDYCPDDWKQANSITHPIRTMQEISRCLESLNNIQQPNLSIDVYTESVFALDREKAFCRRLEAFLPPTTIHVHRQTPLLATVQRIATADLFVPASSYLSAMAAFFCNGLVVLPDEASRKVQYFAPHLKDACPTNIVSVQDSHALTQALETLCKDLELCSNA